MKEYKIAVIGLGYVGLPLAVEFARKYSVIGFDINIQLSTVDFLVFIIAQLILAYCIYQLFKLKRSGGYIFMITNVVFLFYGFVFGPFKSIPMGEILPPTLGFFAVYFVLVIGIPYYYSDKYE